MEYDRSKSMPATAYSIPHSTGPFTFKKHCCIMVIGKTGNGKSTVGNIILGKFKFEIKAGMASMPETRCTVHTVTSDTTELKVVVALDILHQIHTETERRIEVMSWKNHNPNAVLLTIKCDERYTKEEYELYRKVKEFWPGITDQLVVAFTFGENCTAIESELAHASPELNLVLKDACRRYCVFGKYSQLAEKSIHRISLYEIVDKLDAMGSNGNFSSSSTSMQIDTDFDRHNVPMETSITAVEVRKQTKPFCVLIVGNTGTGKSSLSNILLDENKFITQSVSLAKTIQAATKVTKEGITLQVVDTPDLQNSWNWEHTKWTDMASNLPDVILLCVKCDGYRNEDFPRFRQLKTYLGCLDNEISKRLTIAFTFANTAPISVYQFKTLLDEASFRHIFVDCMLTGTDKKKKQRELVLTKLIEYHGLKPVDLHTTTHQSSLSTSSIPMSRPITAGVAAPCIIGKPEVEHCILIIGKTGNGKSTVANAILGCANYPLQTHSQFDVGKGMSSRTIGIHKECIKVERNAKWTVVDTPNISSGVYVYQTEQQREVDKWREVTRPGPTAILLVVRCDGMYTAEEYKVYENIKRLWGPDPSDFTSKLIVAFTFPGETNFKEICRKASDQLMSVLREAHNRHVFFRKGNENESMKELLRLVCKSN